MHDDHGDNGFTVLGFPCNQFGAQEPGSPDELAEFCSTNYGVTFPVSEKIDVNGDGKHAIYGWFQEKFPGDIEWNFEKFLVARDGQVVARFDPRTKPDAAEVVRAIEQELAKDAE